MPWYKKAKTLLKQKGFTYKDIGEALGTGEKNVGHILTGRNNAKLEQIQGIARMLGMSIAELTADDLYYITKEEERKIIDSIRELTDKEQAEILRMIAGYKAMKSE